MPLPCACTRLDFARVCVMLDISSTLPKHIVIMVPKEDGSEFACKVDVEYEWLPPKCTTCMSLGHATRLCPIVKPKQPAVSIYVSVTKQPGDVGKPVQSLLRVLLAVLYRILMISAAVWNVRGLNRSDHQVALRNLISENRLSLVGLLETHVSAANIVRVQLGFPSVDLMHCIHTSVLMTFVYGVNDVGGRRLLWYSIVFLHVGDTPWLVGGDFNTVIDDSEVNGSHGITVAGMLVVFGNAYIGFWLMTVGCRPGRTLITLALILELQTILHSFCEGILLFLLHDETQGPLSRFRALRQRKGDLSNNVKLAASFLETAQTLLAQDRLNTIFLHLEYCCRLILRLATRATYVVATGETCVDERGDQCSRIFFRKVARRRAAKRVFQIMTSTGDTLTDQQDVANEFASFYQTLLGGDQRARSIDLGYLRPWHDTSFEEEGRQLLRHVTTDEAAWPIVGREVTQAILNFFATGKLLKQVNATLLLLIPKELFTGYNQQNLPPRCALKVDLRKAYNTVEWDFLMGSSFFGFPTLFIAWIEECVTTPSFSVCLNGSPHGFFKGARDDLLLFSKADERSVHIFKRGLTIFVELSGLQVDPQKSHLIVSRSAAAVRGALLAILDYQEGFLPLRYLGLPLLASRLSIADCRPLLLKVDSRIKGWDGIMLSFAGRVQLVKSVLMSLQGSTGVGYAKVSWQQVCQPIEEGGLGIKDLLALNRGLMSRHLWKLILGDRSSLWVNWIMHYRLREHSVWTVGDRSGSWGWRKMIHLRGVICPYIEYWIGSGTSFLLWHDPWHEMGPLLTRFPLGPRHTSTLPMAHLSRVIVECVWNWPPITNMESIEITHSFLSFMG
ncbi:UNVERIFIED_CONTAM: hypothetical protein Slati_2455700 [Sesamum latifolium]|uniref:Endonuclease/exonuclease/phosphatase domain-containing protein n=1 Tax=Sesamum latifolium TaxID=2727402 RepID=A0AAW2WH59_9LAMI